MAINVVLKTFLFTIIIQNVYSGVLKFKPRKPLILTFEYDTPQENGKYNYEYFTSDGISREENGKFVPSDDPENPNLVVTGSYSYIGPDNKYYEVNYIADDQGFRHIYTINNDRNPSFEFNQPKPPSVEDCLSSNCQFLPPRTVAGLLG